jgi:hypothetical protein
MCGPNYPDFGASPPRKDLLSFTCVSVVAFQVKCPNRRCKTLLTRCQFAGFEFTVTVVVDSVKDADDPPPTAAEPVRPENVVVAFSGATNGSRPPISVQPTE